MAARGELVTGAQGALLKQETRFKLGFKEQVLALWEIRERELFRAMGYDSLVEYCVARLDIRRTQTYRLLDCAEVFVSVAESPKGDKLSTALTHEGLLRPLAGMKVNGKVRVLQAAAGVAERRKQPLTSQLVGDVARANAGWKSRKEYLAEKRARDPEEQTSEADRTKRRKEIERGLALIHGANYDGYSLRKHFGDPHLFPLFSETLLILKDWDEA